jgi:hypothetical protein
VLGVPAVNSTTTLVAASGVRAKAGVDVGIENTDLIHQC